MKVVGTKASRSTLATEIDLFSGMDLPKAVRKEAAAAVGEFLVEQINIYLADAKSPVSGESFPALSKEYKKDKVSEGFGGVPDLERSGDMKDALTFKVTDEGIELGFFDRKNAGKADGHNNFSGQSELPQRRFLPDEGQKFRREIQSEIENIINETLAENVDVALSDLKEIDTEDDFNELISDLFPSLSRSEAIRAIVTTDLFDKFKKAGLTEFLDG